MEEIIKDFIFIFNEQDLSGYYAIFCVHSWKVLDCQYSSKAPETFIWQYSHNATQAAMANRKRR